VPRNLFSPKKSEAASACVFAAALFVAHAAAAQTDTLTPLLQRGPLVLVEEDANGKFGQATGIVLVDAPPDKVWDTVLAMEKFSEYVPKVTTSELGRKDGNDFDVHFVLDVPGPDTDYTIRFTKDDAKRELKGAWSKGDLKGSRWLWKVEPAAGGKTLLSQQVFLKNFSSLLQSVEDDQQTITVGVTVSTALAAIKAVKRRCEGRATVTK
jgi:ribosome-associated toxin RatA of RatAB toxin-antitoxin module